MISHSLADKRAKSNVFSCHVVDVSNRFIDTGNNRYFNCVESFFHTYITNVSIYLLSMHDINFKSLARKL